MFNKAKSVLLVLASIALAASMQSPSYAANGTLVGRVTNVDTGGAVSGASIWAGVGLPTGTSNSSGNYSISLPANSGYNVLADKSGYAGAHQYGVSIIAGSTTILDFRITTRQGIITGRVIDGSGSPVPSHVIADSTEGNGFGNANTDSNGYFTINRLAPMTYYIHAFPNNTAYAQVAQAGVIVSNGQTTNTTVIINGGSTGKIAGRVTFPDGSGPSNASIYIDSGQTSSAWAGNTDASGNYTSSFLPAAKYNVHVSDVPGWANQVRYDVPVNGGQTAVLNIPLANNTGSIRGWITDINGTPIVGAQVDAFSSSNTGPWGWQTVFSAADGWYDLNRLLPSDRYQIWVHTAGRPSLHADFITLAAGQIRQPYNFTFTFPGKAIAANPSGGYYLLSGTGEVYAYGGANYYGSPTFSWNIARSIAVMPDGLGYIVLDGYGGVHRFGSAASGPISSLVSPYFGWDIARGLAITPSGAGFAVLDGYGGYHARGNAPTPPVKPPYWGGWDIARAIAFSPSGGGYYILDGYGGVHARGDAVSRQAPYFGWDIARGLAITPTNGGFAILDGFGGVHIAGDATVAGPGGYLGADRWRGLIIQGGKYRLVRNDGYAAQF